MEEKEYNAIIFLILLYIIIEFPSLVTSQKLTNIIRLGGSGFVYSNFATFSNMSLVIESSKDSSSPTRIFYGITKEGTPLFENNNFFLSFIADGERKDYENVIITMNDNTHKEYLISFGNDLIVEIYDLYAKKVVNKFELDKYLFLSMVSTVQTAISYNDESNYFTYLAYLDSFKNFKIRKLKFTSPSSYSIDKAYLSDIYGKTATCFMTKKNYIVCLAIYKQFDLKKIFSTSEIISYIYKVYIFDKNLYIVYNDQLDSYVLTSDNIKNCNFYFYKALHLKKEIGVFAFYTENNKYLNLVFKEFDTSSNKLKKYINTIILDKYKANVNNLLNDIIRVDDNKLCFFSTSDNKEIMYLVLIRVYDTKETAVRYYAFDIYNTYKYKFYINMRGYLYNNYISLSFSYCRSSKCASSSDTHYPGLIIFSYPNGTDTNIDLINEMIYDQKKKDNITINLNNKIKIDNNIFGLVNHHIQIADIIDCGSIIFISSNNTNKNIEKNYTLKENENIIAKNFSFEKTECQIWYYYFISEANFNTYNSYANITDFKNNYKEKYFNRDLYKSRLLNYNIIIKEDLANKCPENDKNCLICQQKNTSHCIICEYNYLIHNTKSEKYKTCMPEGVNITNDVEVFEGESSREFYEEEAEEEAEYDSELSENYTKQIEQEVSCNYFEILTNECKNGKLSNTQISDVYEIMKEIYLTESNDEESTVVVTENVVYQVATFEYQKNNEEANVSSIDLGTCEQSLKNVYGIYDNQSLIVFKIDYKNPGTKQTFVQYEIYSPNNLSNPLNLSVCNNTKIIINTPVDLNDNSIQLYESVSSYGYDIFNSSDDFYTDICSVYTTEKGTDMLIQDRKNDIYNGVGNTTMCQNGCVLSYYNTTTKKSVCACEPQVEESSTENIDKDKFSSKK